MKITTITVTAARGFNHPHESFANFKLDSTLTAELDPQEDAEAVHGILRAKVEALADKAKADILADIRHKREIAEAQQQVDYLRSRIKQTEQESQAMAAAEQRLADLCNQPLRLHDSAALKIIHPGHDDHPDTDANGYDQRD